MSDNEIIEKIQKLLKLSESSNVHEAALAAQRAADLMLKYNIEKSVLDFDQNKKEEIEYSLFEKNEGSNKNRFQGDLASAIASFFDAQILWRGNDLWLVGSKSDLNATKYLFQAISNQITELCESAWWSIGKWSGVHGKTWKGSFRQGALDEIKKRLVERKKTFKSEFSSNSKELVVVNEHARDVKAFLASMSIRTLAPSNKSINAGAYNSGVSAGSSVNIGGGSSLSVKRNLSSGSTIGIGLKR